MSDIFTLDENNNAAVRTVSVKAGAVESNQPDIFTTDENGNAAVRVTGGGGDQHNLGYYADLTALQTAHPTGTDGDYAILGSTDTIWVWDSGTSAWVDSDQKGQVTSVNGQTGAVTISANDLLPSQTGQSGKFLTTDGTDASWSENLVLLANNTKVGFATSYSGNYNVVIGNHSNCGYGNYETVIGSSAFTTANYTLAVGANSSARQANSIALGARTSANATNAIQLGSTGAQTTNSDADTFKVANGNGNFEIMSADGTIPKARLVNALSSTTVTIAVADWNGGTTASKTINGLTATSVVFVAPDNASQSDYLDAGVYASAQTTDTLTFTCTTTPTSSLTVTVVFC